MACEIKDVVVSAEPGDFDPNSGAISYLTVSGTAVDCRSRLVRLSVRKGTAVFSANAIQVDLAGNWSWRVKVAGIACGDQVEVAAACLHEVDCTYTATLTVSCCIAAADVTLSVDSPNGPLTEAELEGWDCVAPGQDYTVAVTNPTGAGFTYDWQITEGRQPGDPPDQSGTAASTFTLPLPGDGVRRTILVVIHQPGDCPDLYRSVSFRDCGPPTDGCPPGTVWNPVTRQCEADCPPGEAWDPVANECRPEEEPPEKEPPEKEPPGNGEPASCGGVLWAAVILLALSLLIAIFANCFTAIAAYLYVLAAILFALYLILLGIYKWLVRSGFCKRRKCRIAEVHVLVLAPIAMVLGIMAILCQFIPALPWCGCWNAPALAVFSAVLGFWADRLRRCRAR